MCWKVTTIAPAKDRFKFIFSFTKLPFEMFSENRDSRYIQFLNNSTWLDFQMFLSSHLSPEGSTAVCPSAGVWFLIAVGTWALSKRYRQNSYGAVELWNYVFSLSLLSWCPKILSHWIPSKIQTYFAWILLAWFTYVKIYSCSFILCLK